MEIKELDINKLHEYENNPRHNENAVDAVAASIQNFGFKVPIVVDKDGIIVAGHTRFKAAKKLGLQTVPCIVADDLTPEQIKAFRVADNKTAELAEWDFELLENELAELAAIDFDMEQFGFSENEDDEIPTDLDKEEEKNNVQVTIIFENDLDYKCIENDLKSLVETNNGTLTVKMA